MARVPKSQEPRSARKGLTVSHRERLIAELRADTKLTAEYLNAAAEDTDPRIYLAALRTLAEAQGMAKVAKAAGVTITRNATHATPHLNPPPQGGRKLRREHRIVSRHHLNPLPQGGRKLARARAC